MLTERGFEFDQHVYRQRVDGKNRAEGVRSVMVDATDEEIEAAGAQKQAYYLQELESTNLEPYSDAKEFLAAVENAGLHLAAASGSANAPRVLERIGILDRFQAVVTGAEISSGKPDPEIFLTAADRLGLPSSRCVVFEDSEAGITAAKKGAFLSVGVAREGNSAFLREADLVVSSLNEITIDQLEGLIR
jgi:HAD superfamily hydrolase (TIGR01509 family)